MPAIIDKEQMRKDILSAFEQCVAEKPLSAVSLRDIAAKANMTHPKLLNYFSNKEDIVKEYCKYVNTYMTDHCTNWFKENKRSDFSSNLEYLNQFMKYVAEGDTNDARPTATPQLYVLGHYDSEIAIMIQEEFANWKRTMNECLQTIYGEEVGSEQAELMMVLIAGTFICNYNHVLSGEINNEFLSTFSKLM